MKENVLVVLATKNYLDQAKQLFSAAYWKAGWKGDYLLLAHEIEPGDVTWFLNKGIIVKHCKSLMTSGLHEFGVICITKFYMFTKYFKQWKNVVYLDVDIIIRGPIDDLSLIQGFGACHSLGQTIKDILVDFDKIDKTLAKDIQSKYNLNMNTFNAGVLAFSTDIITDNIFDELVAIFYKYMSAAAYDDQTILNLYFIDSWIELPPVYNRTIEKKEYVNINPDNFEGILIHTVSQKDGPWNIDNVFHNEWKYIFNKADLIDLLNIPNITPWTNEKIQQQSRLILKAHFTGCNNSLLYFFKKSLRLIFHNPGRAIIKVKQILKMLNKKY